MKIIKNDERESLDPLTINLEGSSKISIKPISANVVFIEVHPGGCTPDHSHKDVERIIVMSGRGLVKVNESTFNIESGDYIESDPEEQHQIVNNNNEKLGILCFRNQ